MKFREKFKGIFKKKNKVNVPQNPWPTQKPIKSSSRTSSVFKPTKKIRVPGLRTGKRLLAGLVMVINFFIMCASLMSASVTQPLFWLFFLNFVILVDYLWKTRSKETI